MIITVRVTPNAKKAVVTKIDDSTFEVKVDEIAEGGKANRRLLEILSDHFGVKKSALRIISGAKTRDKIVSLTTTAEQEW